MMTSLLQSSVLDGESATRFPLCAVYGSNGEATRAYQNNHFSAEEQKSDSVIILSTATRTASDVGDHCSGPAIIALQTMLVELYEFISALNNAAWPVVEVALRYGRGDGEFQQWVHH
jgi:hypothetical protein